MEKDRDDILNEMIEYYDANIKPPQEAEPATEGDMGATRVIKPAAASQTAPPESASGDTQIVDINKPQMETAPPQEKPAAQAPFEEVLGNLDLIGSPIAEKKRAQSAPPPRRREAEAPKPIQKPKPAQEPVRVKKSGVWYTLKPLWVTLIICAVMSAAFKFYITDTGLIGLYKRNFNYNMGLICDMLGIEWIGDDVMPTVGRRDIGSILDQSEQPLIDINSYTETDNTHTQTQSAYLAAGDNRAVIPFSGAADADFAAVGGDLIAAKSNYLCRYASSGDLRWDTETSISDPILSVNGDYIAIASEGSTHVSLYKGEKCRYSVNVPNAIRACNVSGNGDVVLITDKPSYKGAVIMLNSKGQLVFSWSSGVNYITSAVALKNRRIAVSLISTEPAVTSYMMMFDIKSTEPLSGAEFDDILIYRMSTNGKDIYINGDNSIANAGSKGSVSYDIRFDDALITRSATDLRGNRLVAYIRDNIPIMNLYKPNGQQEETLYTESVPDHIDVYKSTILYNDGNNIICGGVRDDMKTEYTAPRSVKRLMLLGSRAYAIVYEDSIEIIKI